jgi:hypothetical protein
MSDSSARHFTVVDDWVMLHPGITATEYRIYSVIKGNIRHAHGGIPETGFRATAAWISEVSGGLFSVSTAHKAMQSMAKKGILRRLNNPQSGEGADFEFAIVPPEEYEGPTSVMARAAEVSKKKSRRIVFMAVPLDRKPRRRPAGNSRGKLVMDAPAASVPELQPEPEPAPAEAEPEFDLSGLDRLGREPEPPQGAMARKMNEFAEELEALTGQNSEEHLRLMTGACHRLAELARPALVMGWEPRALAKRLAAELNPKIHSPENLLMRKIPDIGKPPAVVKPGDGKVLIKGKAVDLSAYDMGFNTGGQQAPVQKEPAEAPDTRQGGKNDRLAQLARRSLGS